MFHLAAFAAALPNNSTNTALTAVTDNAWTVSANGRYISPDRLEIFAAQALNDALSRARVSAPSMRNVGLPDINPITVANLQATSPAIDYRPNGIYTVQANEEFGVDATCGVDTVLFGYAALWLRKNRTKAPVGKCHTIVGTASITQVARGWAQGTITLDQLLPAGRFSIIGAHCQITNGLFFRLIFPESNAMRPGAPCVASAGQFDQRQLFRNGNAGEWGQFTQTSQPVLETFANTAGAQTATVFLDVVPLTPGLEPA